MTVFESIFRTKAKPHTQAVTGSSGSIGGRSSLMSSRIPSPSQRVQGFNPKLRIYTTTQAKVVNQAAFCMPSCPIEDDLHYTDVQKAHDRLMKGQASEEDEELILSFLAHHPFQAGNVTDKIWWTSDKPATLMMLGNPLSFTDPEIQPATFEPIRVAPIKPAG